MQRRFRLRRSADFERVRKDGRVWRHPFVMLSAAKNDLGHNRYAFVTSRRLGGAVVRNRIRRMLREMTRLTAPRLRQGYDIVFIARNEIVGQPYNKINDVIGQLFKRADLFRQEENQI
jgi:ribonuclease P protein component